MQSLDLIQLLAMCAVSLPALAFTAQKFLSMWKSTGVETSVISLMHGELERMSEQNTTISIELGKLQVEIIRLNQQLRVLTEENQRLHTEVVSLTGEVARLQKLFK